MIEWLFTNLDEVFGTVVGFTTMGAFWFAYKGRNGIAAAIGLSGNVMWWGYWFTASTLMLVLPIAGLTFIHAHTLRLALRDRRKKREQPQQLAPEPMLDLPSIVAQCGGAAAKADGGWCAPDQLTAEQILPLLREPHGDLQGTITLISGLLSSQQSGPACSTCGHTANDHGPHGGCGIIGADGMPCGCAASAFPSTPPERTS